jgi:hypothetical protein
MFAAMRRAQGTDDGGPAIPSRSVMYLTDQLRKRCYISSLLRVSSALTVGPQFAAILHDEASVVAVFDGPGRREAARLGLETRKRRLGASAGINSGEPNVCTVARGYEVFSVASSLGRRSL